MIASLPKSASAYVASVSSLLLEVPVCRISAGQFPNFQVIPGWARQVALGGAVTHEHFGPSTHNLDAIKAAGLRHVAVQIRDPRQTLISYVHIDAVIEMMPEAAKSEVTDRVGWALQSYFGQMVRWIGDWAEIADLQPAGLRSADLQSEDLDPGLEICMVSFEDFVADKARFFCDLWRFFGLPAEIKAVEEALGKLANPAIPGVNFRRGEADEWRRVVTTAQRRAMWELIPPDLAKRFGWRE